MIGNPSNRIIYYFTLLSKVALPLLSSGMIHCFLFLPYLFQRIDYEKQSQ